MNITAEQQPPTLRETRAEFKRLSKLNKERILTYGRNAGPGAFSEIGSNNEMTANSVKSLLKYGVSKWKQRHFKVWNDCKNYVKI